MINRKYISLNRENTGTLIDYIYNIDDRYKFHNEGTPSALELRIGDRFFVARRCFNSSAFIELEEPNYKIQDCEIKVDDLAHYIITGLQFGIDSVFCIKTKEDLDKDITMLYDLITNKKVKTISVFEHDLSDAKIVKIIDFEQDVYDLWKMSEKSLVNGYTDIHTDLEIRKVINIIEDNYREEYIKNYNTIDIVLKEE